MTQKIYTHHEITAIIITTARQVFEQFRGERMKILHYQAAMQQTLTALGYSIRLDWKTIPRFGDKQVGPPETIHLVVNKLIGVCIVRGHQVSDLQRNGHRHRIRAADLEVGLVISFDGPYLSVKRIDLL